MNRSASLLILAQPRMGSSFLGQLFNQHPDVFFLYEPLHSFSMFKKLNYVSAMNYSQLVASFLRNAHSCRFSGFQDYFSFISHPGLSSPHFRLSSKALSSPPLCDSSVATFSNHSLILSKCPLLNATTVSLVCSSRKLVVTKVLIHRLPSYDLQQYPKRVIHLVRDPRAVVWSMLRMGLLTRGDTGADGNNCSWKLPLTPELTKESVCSFSKQVRLVCDQMAKDVYFSKHFPKRLGQLYKIVRYEELASNMAHLTPQLFDFAGLDISPEVTELIRGNTILNASHGEDAQQSYSTTNRNAVATLNSWRSGLTFDETGVIDKECADFIKNFGYGFAESEQKLRNTNASLLESRNN